jgi:hypothetical protein
MNETLQNISVAVMVGSLNQPAPEQSIRETGERASGCVERAIG